MTKKFSKLTDPQWAAIAPATRFAFFNLKRKHKHDLRQVINIILWFVRTGLATFNWRQILGTFGGKPEVSHEKTRVFLVFTIVPAEQSSAETFKLELPNHYLLIRE